MHTIGRNTDKTWWVARAEMLDGTTNIMLLFDRLSFGTALRMVNCLNGGDASAAQSSDLIKLWEMCTHG